MPKLLVKCGAESVEVELKDGSNTFGSGTGNHFQIEDPSVSELHCEIIVDGSKVLVKDLDSTNGTLIDREPIHEAVLRRGQVLQLGHVEMVLEGAIPATRPAIPSSPDPITAPCRNHPGSSASFICERCHQLFCGDCVSSRSIGKTILRFCGSCGGSCAAIDSKLGVRARMATSSSTLLAGAFAYPFKRDGLLLILGGTLFFALMDLLSSFSFGAVASLGFSVFALGYMCAYLQKIIQSSAHGDEQMPPWPDISEFGPEVLQPALQYIGTFIFCLGPGLACLILTPGGSRLYGYLLLALGVLYLPMALLAVTLYDTLAALNPLLIIKSIVRVPAPYAGACVGLAAAVGAGLAMDALSELVRVPVLTSIAFGFAALYFQVVAMRVLGIFYYTQRERLSWF